MKMIHLGVALTALSLGHAASAATITWTSGTITDINDVVTTGTTVEAVNTAGTGANATVTVAGITFAENNDVGGNNTNGDFFALETGDAGYDEFLGDIDFGGNGQPAATFEFTGLTVTQAYLIQYWYADDGANGRTMTLDSFGGTDLVLSSGDFAIGTFTADSVTQDLTFTSSNNGIRVTGFQLRAVPEPTSAALFGLGAAGFLLRRRRR